MKTLHQRVERIEQRQEQGAQAPAVAFYDRGHPMPQAPASVAFLLPRNGREAPEKSGRNTQ